MIIFNCIVCIFILANLIGLGVRVRRSRVLEARTAFMHHCRYNSVDYVKKVLEKANLDITKPYYVTWEDECGLYRAIRGANVEVIKYLIKQNHFINHNIEILLEREFPDIWNMVLLKRRTDKINNHLTEVDDA